MDESSPLISYLPSPDGGTALVLGRWTAARLTQSGTWASVQSALQAVTQPGRSTWDLRAVQRLDHIGAQLLWNHWGRQWPAAVQIQPGHRAVMERVARFTVAPPPGQVTAAGSGQV